MGQSANDRRRFVRAAVVNDENLVRDAQFGEGRVGIAD
jgi:hypothetical protein